MDRAPLLSLLLFCGAWAFCLVALEISFRLFLPMAPLPSMDRELPERSAAIHYVSSIFSRHAIAPRTHTVERGGGTIYRINDKGYRGEDFAWQKPVGAVRIVVYGGSAVFDILQREGQDWPARVERRLVANGHPQVEVINAGIPAHATFDCVGRLLAEGHRLSPDYALLYNAWNDIKYFRDDSPLLRQFGPYRAADDPFARPRGRLDAGLAEVSHLYRFARLRFLLWNHLPETEGRIPPGEIGNVFSLAQVEQFGLNVASFVDVARNAGATPILMTQARLVVAGASEEQRQRIRYDLVKLDHDALVAAFSATDRAVRDVARAKEIHLIDAAAELSGVDAYFSDHIHLSDEGSRALSQLVADHLASLLAEHGPRLARSSAAVPSR